MLPRNTIDWMASTRPRYSGPASTWTMAVDDVMKAMDARPRKTDAANAAGWLGAAASANMATPKPIAATTSCRAVTTRRRAVPSAPTSEPRLSTLNSRVNVPSVPPSVVFTSRGMVTEKLKASVPIRAIITSGTNSWRSARM